MRQELLIHASNFSRADKNFTLPLLRLFSPLLLLLLRLSSDLVLLPVEGSRTQADTRSTRDSWWRDQRSRYFLMFHSVIDDHVTYCQHWFTFFMDKRYRLIRACWGTWQITVSWLITYIMLPVSCSIMKKYIYESSYLTGRPLHSSHPHERILRGPFPARVVLARGTRRADVLTRRRGRCGRPTTLGLLTKVVDEYYDSWSA